MAVTIHGMFGTRTYKSWVGMCQRCTNPHDIAYRHYGGRGISVCDSWREFTAFYADMGECPPALTLDRIDNNGNYEPGNCRWADHTTQQNNKRNNNVLTLNGESATITEWARRTGIGATTIRARILRGWSLTEALTIPPSGLATKSAAKRAELSATEPALPLATVQLAALGICQYGHELTDDNTYFARNHLGNVKRRCRLCARRSVYRARVIRAAAKAAVPFAAPV